MVEYLSEVQLRHLHGALIQATGGASGMLDPGRLQAAVARPAASFGGQDLYDSLPAKAAALMHSLISGHPFVDGNKRVAVAATELFLQVNGHRLKADDTSLETLTMAAAASQVGMEEIRIWIEQRLERE